MHKTPINLSHPWTDVSTLIKAFDRYNQHVASIAIAFIFISVYISPLSIQSQSNIDLQTDSLLNIAASNSDFKLQFDTYQKLMVAYTKINNNKSKAYCRKMIEVGKKADNNLMLTIGHSRYSIFLTVEGKLDSSIQEAHKAYSFARYPMDTLAMAKAEHALGWYYAYSGNYLLAREYYQKSINKYKSTNDSSGLLSTNVKMFFLHKQMGEHQKSIDLGLQLIRTYPENSMLVYNLANAYDASGEKDIAKKYFTQYLEMTSHLPNNYRTGNAEASLYRLSNDVEKESEKRRFILDEVDKIGEPMMMHHEAQNYAAFLIRSGRNKDAVNLLEERKKMTPDNIKPAYRLRYYTLLREANENLGNYQDAYKYSELFIDTREEYSKRHNLDRVIDREKNLEFERKNNTIEQLKIDQKTTSKKINLMWLSLFSILGLLGLSLYLFFKNKATNKTLQQQNIKLDKSLDEKHTLLQETHHRVKNNLQIISSLLNLQRKYIDDKKMTGILTNSRNRVKSMALIHQMLYQNEMTYGINAKEYTQTLTSSLLSSYRDKSDNIRIINNVSDLQLHEDTINPIGLIINELVTNSIKYAFPETEQGTIEVSLLKSRDQLILKVSDDGIGMNKSMLEGSDSFGYSLVHSLAKKLKATVETTTTTGTVVELIINHFVIVERD